MRISDWSSDVCSSDLTRPRVAHADLRRLAVVLGGWHLRQRRRAEVVDVVAALLQAGDAVELAHVRVARDADHPADPLVADEVEQIGAPGEGPAPGIAALLVHRARHTPTARQHLD